MWGPGENEGNDEDGASTGSVKNWCCSVGYDEALYNGFGSEGRCDCEDHLLLP